MSLTAYNNLPSQQFTRTHNQPNGVTGARAQEITSQSFDSIKWQTKTSHYQRNYQVAIKHYLNRNFDRAWDAVYPSITEILNDDTNNIDTSLTLKLFKLYLSLIDLIIKEINHHRLTTVTVSKEDLKFPRIIENEALSSELIDNFLKGELLQQLKQISPANEQLDPGLLLMCFIIELSNGFDPTTIRIQVEEYLIREGILVNGKPTVIQDDNDMTNLKMVEFYLFCVLPKLNQHDVSKKYIKVLFSYDATRFGKWK
ncbi:unnamed protein product [Ambrosiozyma monospora]|uniref:Unnamed protein product n=1 Tax=Ambrosiozyma monospora TaxID=43982 RepID=A0ACB5SRJ8_AMBMO|nr:unnamed protein product [Ambrosiozyma monospora]